MPGLICGVCSRCESKYKCPKCLVRYCALDCFKSHSCQISRNLKDNQDQFPQVHQQQKSLRDSKEKEDIYQQLGISMPDGFVLQKNQIELLMSHPRIQSMISSPTLRKVLMVIDKSPNKSKSFEAMNKASQNHTEYFEFSQLVLDILDKDRDDSLRKKS